MRLEKSVQRKIAGHQALLVAVRIATDPQIACSIQSVRNELAETSASIELVCVPKLKSRKWYPKGKSNRPDANGLRAAIETFAAIGSFV